MKDAALTVILWQTPRNFALSLSSFFGDKSLLKQVPDVIGSEVLKRQVWIPWPRLFGLATKTPKSQLIRSHYVDYKNRNNSMLPR